VGEDVVLAAVTDLALAVLEAMWDRIDVARALYHGARQRLEDLGLGVRLAGLEMWPAIVELIGGDPRVIESDLERAYEALGRVGERGRLPTTAAFLARVHFVQGRLDEALQLTQISEELASRHDMASQIVWRGVRARVCVRAGDSREAEKLARAGVALARHTDFVYLHGEALTDLADVLEVLDQPDAAVHALDEAIALHDAKQNHASARATRALRRPLAVDSAEA
jgi:ATP/maltotriose-dependent transcriptional regulator MalT